MKLSQIPIIASLVFSACSTAPVTNKPVKAFPSFSGDIFQSKRSFNLRYDQHFLEADRYSITKPDKPADSMNVDDYSSAIMNEDPAAKKTATNQYYIVAKEGEQYRLPLLNKVTVWLNAASVSAITLKAGKPTHLMVNGQAYIETLQPLTVSVNDSLDINCAKSSKLDVSNYDNDGMVTFSLVKGQITVSGKYVGGAVNKVLQLPGETLTIDKTGEIISLEEYDPEWIASWKDAGLFHFNNTNLKQAMNIIDRWYNTTTNYNKEIPDYKLMLSFPYKTPLDSALMIIGRVVPVNLERRNDTIYVNNKPNPKN